MTAPGNSTARFKAWYFFTSRFAYTAYGKLASVLAYGC